MTLTSVANTPTPTHIQQSLKTLNSIAESTSWLPTKSHQPHGPTFARELASEIFCRNNIQCAQYLSRRDGVNVDDTAVLPLINFWQALHTAAGHVVSNFKRFVGLDKPDFNNFANREVETLMTKLQSGEIKLKIANEDSKGNNSLVLSLYDENLPRQGDNSLIRITLLKPTTGNEKLKVTRIEFPAQGALSGHGNQEIKLVLTSKSTEFAAGETHEHQREGSIELALGNEAFEKLSSFILSPEFKIKGKAFIDLVND